MDIDRRNLALPMFAAGLLAALPALAQGNSAEDRALVKQVEAFRDAQRAKDAKALTALCADELSYSHSNAAVEDKATFVTNATSPKTKVVFINYDDIWARTLGDVALVRFHWTSESEVVADGKRSGANLHVLMVWTKKAGDWKLLGRCSTKLA
jgi:ketosteroid isomerase-like protein